MGPIAVRRMFDQMVDCISQMILKWERHGPDYEINTPDDFSRLTFDVIGYVLCILKTMPFGPPLKGGGGEETRKKGGHHLIKEFC